MDAEFIEISTKNGKLRGMVKKSFENNSTYYSFQGIPYAKPPVGDLRFQVPKPYGQWENVLDATKEGNDPAQTYPFLQDIIGGSEDCLYLNVYIPQKPTQSGLKKAVMVYIHGGAYQRGSGSASIHGPDYLIEEDIVLVIINYRVGALGFLSLENETVPGNMGLKDQSLALRWVQDNISSFGGDPNNVTIFGQSAGSSSVHYQMLSPLSKGLFHKAILQSGSSLSQWALQDKPRETALLLASALGCTSQDDETVLKFLRFVPVAEIVKLQEGKPIATDKVQIQRCGLNFIPCVETTGTAPFLPDTPRKMMERGEFSKVPIIIGATDKEGLISVAINEINCERVNRDITVMVPLNLKIPSGSEEEKALGRKILKFYTNRDVMSMDIDTVKGYVNFMTDVLFAWGCVEARRYFLKHLTFPVYSYVFTYINHRSIFSSLVKTAYPVLGEDLFNYGACHSDDLTYLFKTNLPQKQFISPSSAEKVLMKKFVKSWSSFAKTGNPNCKELGVTWHPDNFQNPNYMEIEEHWKEIKSTYSPKREQFWDSIYSMYSHSF